MTDIERLRGLREDKDLTQEQLGKILNMTQRKISRLEKGDTQITISDLKAYCDFFKISADYILGYKKPLPWPR